MQACLIFARGKKSLTYEIKTTVEFKGGEEFDDCSATLKFEEFTDHGDREYSLKCDSGAKKEPFKQAVKEEIPRIIRVIEEELNRYKEL